MRHAPIPSSSTLTEVIECKYGRMHEGLTVEFTADEWSQADIPALRFEDSLSMGEWLLVPPERQRQPISIEDWASLSPKLLWRSSPPVPCPCRTRAFTQSSLQH